MGLGFIHDLIFWCATFRDGRLGNRKKEEGVKTSPSHNSSNIILFIVPFTDKSHLSNRRDTRGWWFLLHLLKILFHVEFYLRYTFNCLWHFFSSWDLPSRNINWTDEKFTYVKICDQLAKCVQNAKTFFFQILKKKSLLRSLSRNLNFNEVKKECCNATSQIGKIGTSWKVESKLKQVFFEAKFFHLHQI